MNDADQEIVERLKRFRQQDAVNLIESQAAEIKRLRETYGNGCPCRHTTPCQPNCTCAKSMMSHGCRRCCRYGSKQQQVAMAEHLAAMHEAIQAAQDAAAKEQRDD